MTDLLTQVGEALYGPRWQSEMARELGVADRTVRRWVAGEMEPPAGVWDDLLGLVGERQGALRLLVSPLRQAAKP